MHHSYLIKEIASSFQVHRNFLQYMKRFYLLCNLFFQTESIYVSNDNLWDEDLFPIFLCILVPLYIAKKKMLHFFFLLLSIYLFPVDVSTGDNLPENKIGELCIRGPQIMKGYLDNEKATEETIKKGWLHTGDIAYHDSDGNIFITDRLKELIKVKGFQVTSSISFG